MGDTYLWIFPACCVSMCWNEQHTWTNSKVQQEAGVYTTHQLQPAATPTAAHHSAPWTSLTDRAGSASLKNCWENPGGDREHESEQMVLYLSSQTGITLPTKFNLISTKLRQIHLDTASQKSRGARWVIFLFCLFFYRCEGGRRSINLLPWQLAPSDWSQQWDVVTAARTKEQGTRRRRRKHDADWTRTLNISSDSECH